MSTCLTWYAYCALHVHACCPAATQNWARLFVQVEDGRTVFHIACLKCSAELVLCLANVTRLDVHAADVRVLVLTPRCMRNTSYLRSQRQRMTGFQHVKANEAERGHVLRVLAHHPRWLGQWEQVRGKTVVPLDTVTSPTRPLALRDAMGVKKASEISKVMQRRLMLRFDAGKDSSRSPSVK